MSGSPFGILEMWSSGKATEAQSEAAASAIASTEKMFNLSREDQAPWMEAGKWALNRLSGSPGGEPIYGKNALIQPSTSPELGPAPPREIVNPQRPWGDSDGNFDMVPNPAYQEWLINRAFSEAAPPSPGREITGYTEATPGMIDRGPGEFTESPGYQFTLDEGMKGIQRAASATGRLGSGATMKGAARYAEGLASTEYDNFLNRWYKSMDPYFTLAGMGQTTAGQLGQGALSTGNQLANLNLASGNAQAAGYLGQGNILSNQFSSAGNNIGQYFMNRFGGGQQGGGGGGWGGFGGGGGGYYGTQGAYYQPGEYASYNFL